MSVVDHQLDPHKDGEAEPRQRPVSRRTVLKAAAAASAVPLISSFAQSASVSPSNTASNNCEPPKLPLEPTTQKFIDSLAGAKPARDMTPAAAHKVLTDLQSAPPPIPLKPADITDTTF